MLLSLPVSTQRSVIYLSSVCIRVFVYGCRFDYRQLNRSITQEEEHYGCQKQILYLQSPPLPKVCRLDGWDGRPGRCAPAAPGTTPEGGSAPVEQTQPAQVLRYPMSNQITGNWDYTLSGGGYGLTMGLELMDGLTELDVETGEARPKVAESWEFLEDGAVVHFTLRDDVTWSDGSPVTAHDFEFAIKHNLDPETASEYAWALYQIEGAEDFNSGVTDNSDGVGVTALDDTHLEIRLREPTPYLPMLTALWVTSRSNANYWNT